MKLNNLFLSLFFLFLIVDSSSLTAMNKQTRRCEGTAQLAQDIVELFEMEEAEHSSVSQGQQEQARLYEFLVQVTQNHDLLQQEGSRQRIVDAPIELLREFLLDVRNESLLPTLVSEFSEKKFHELIRRCISLQLKPCVYTRLMSERPDDILDVIAHKDNLTGDFAASYLDVYLRIPAVRALLISGCDDQVQKAIDRFQAKDQGKYKIDPLVLARTAAKCTALTPKQRERVRAVQFDLLKDFCKKAVIAETIGAAQAVPGVFENSEVAQVISTRAKADLREFLVSAKNKSVARACVNALDAKKFHEVIDGQYDLQLIPAVQQRLIQEGPEALKAFVENPVNNPFVGLYFQIPEMRKLLLAQPDERVRKNLKKALLYAVIASNNKQRSERKLTGKESVVRTAVHGFSGDTLVKTLIIDDEERTMTDGYETINQVHRNPRETEQFVYSANQKRNATRTISKVKGTCVGEVNCYTVISFDAKKPYLDISCMHTQEFYVPALKKWVPAILLRSGDCLVDDKGHKHPVRAVTLVNKPMKVYALAIEDTHTFYVGYNSILTHNYSIPVSSVFFTFTYVFGEGFLVGAGIGSKYGTPLAIGMGAIIGGVFYAGAELYKLVMGSGEQGFKIDVHPEELQKYLKENKPKKWEKVKKSNLGYSYPDADYNFAITPMPGGPGGSHEDSEHHHSVHYDDEEEKNK